jgi:hypothetical protein
MSAESTTASSVTPVRSIRSACSSLGRGARTAESCHRRPSGRRGRRAGCRSLTLRVPGRADRRRVRSGRRADGRSPAPRTPRSSRESQLGGMVRERPCGRSTAAEERGGGRQTGAVSLSPRHGMFRRHTPWRPGVDGLQTAGRGWLPRRAVGWRSDSGAAPTRDGARVPGWERRRTGERSARCSFRCIGRRRFRPRRRRRSWFGWSFGHW